MKKIRKIMECVLAVLTFLLRRKSSGNDADAKD